MDLSQYKIVRSNKFPLPAKKPANKSDKPNFIDTVAILCNNNNSAYEIHIADQASKADNKNKNGNDNPHVLIFNDH
jgi:hypothetical protein